LLTVTGWAAEPVSSERLPLNRFPRMMQEWLVDQVAASQKIGNKRRDALKSEADAKAYVELVRGLIRESFGPEPEKTPLNARVTSITERETYRIEKVVFESRPGFLVTGNLYVPKGKEGPMPAVVGTCGHSLNGKAETAYQSFCQGLARMGYVVLIYDPIGQGERFQYIKDEGAKGLKSRYGGSVSEHIQCGNQQGLVGEFFGAWRAWDGVRALDYLLSRPEVDPKRVGVTGNSGGGTMTTWLCGVESRWSMAAPSCFVTTFLHNAENELPADTEQCPPQVLALGLDHSDFLAAMAPKPVIVLAKERDFFDARGSEESYERLKKLYTLLGAPEHVKLFIGPTYHGYTQENREAMYQFFNKTTGVSDAQTEPALTIEKDPELWCAPKGQVSELKSKTVMEFTAEAAAVLSGKRGKLDGAALVPAMKKALRLAEVQGAPPYRILRSAGSRGYPSKSSCCYAVETEPGILSFVTRLFDEALTSRLPRGQKRAVLYIAHHSADAELVSEPLVQDLIAAEKDAAFFACDPRGIGESKPNTCGVDQFLKPYGSDYFYAAHGLMLDRPVLGQRVEDVLRVIELLTANGHEEIHLAGRGWGAIVAAIAACLAAPVKQVTLKNALSSWTDVATTADYKWPFAMLPHGVLNHFDLPDCYELLATKKALKNIDPWGAEDGMNL
jgi:dienelactone hydrolase